MPCNKFMTQDDLDSIMHSVLTDEQIREVKAETARQNQPHRGNGAPPGQMPNPEIPHVAVGDGVYFVDNFGGLHKHASEAIAENMRGEEVSFSVTDGNCGQDPDLVPDFVPDPHYKK